MAEVMGEDTSVEIMSTIVQLEPKKGYVAFHPEGEVLLGECANLVCDAVRLACDQGAEKLLVDVSGLTGFEPPTTAPRYFFNERLAAEATSPIKVAMVCRPEFIREDHYGVMIARNRGLLCEIFASESEALEWLLRP
ncbi:hypothetical protein [Pedosphaera parvula]|uniref:STAS/SEC14 domain-containing protein n=1 Tax=Pedosphaera parvula (strain Ellin514) TaxID=320771 RepID=B9XQ29_PEDPL|nr:hypothetical protein [Pedosphaera parvula]EEF58033.1 hypothetical protein Cflav_PD1170 [Pedosphaera parvula Ellin514]